MSNVTLIFSITKNNGVFLGDVTKLRLYENAWNVNLVFANENDEGIDSITLNYSERVSSDPVASAPAKMYFCKTGAVYDFNGASLDIEMRHFADERKDASKDLATCEKHATVYTYCYCGELIGDKELDGTALGHSHTVFVGLIYDDYSKNGYYSYQCERCDNLNNEKTAPALFDCLGYSAAEYGDGGMTIGFRVNEGAISDYEEITGESVSYGVFAAKAERIGNNDIFDENGASRTGVITADITNSGFNIFNLRIVGFTEEQKEIGLAMGAFVGTSKDGVSKYSYMQIDTPAMGEKYFFASYNDVLALLQSGEVTQ